MGELRGKSQRKRARYVCTVCGVGDHHYHRAGQPCVYCVDGWTRRRRGVLWWFALVALVPAVACCVLGVIVGVRDGWAYTVDGLILESIGCLVAAIALPVLFMGE